MKDIGGLGVKNCTKVVINRSIFHDPVENSKMRMGL